MGQIPHCKEENRGVGGGGGGGGGARAPGGGRAVLELTDT